MLCWEKSFYVCKKPRIFIKARVLNGRPQWGLTSGYIRKINNVFNFGIKPEWTVCMYVCSLKVNLNLIYKNNWIENELITKNVEILKNIKRWFIWNVSGRFTLRYKRSK